MNCDNSRHSAFCGRRTTRWAPATVAIAVLIAVTLLPALLGFADDKVRSRLRDRRGGPKAGGRSMGER